MKKWWIVTLLALGMVIAYVDRANLSTVLALTEFKTDFQLDDEQRGLLSSAFFWSYALLQIPAGWIVDRYGARWPYAIGFVLWSAASAVSGFAHSIGQLAAARLALGVGESVSTAASLRWIRWNCPEQQRGLATGILFAGTKTGAALGAPITVALIAFADWRAMFVILGGGGLVWLVAFLASVRENPPSRSQAARANISARELLRTPAIWGILLGTFAYNYFIYFCLTWLPAYFIEARHLSPRAMSVYTAFSFGGMAIVGILAGAAADRWIARGGDPVRVRRAFTLLGFLIASSEVIGILTPSNQMALFFAIFSLTGLGFTTANYWALTQTIFPAAAIGRMIGIQNFASNLSGIVAPIVTGRLKKITGGYDAAGWAILAVLLIGVIAYGLLVRADAGARFREVAA